MRKDTGRGGGGADSKAWAGCAVFPEVRDSWAVKIGRVFGRCNARSQSASIERVLVDFKTAPQHRQAGVEQISRTAFPLAESRGAPLLLAAAGINAPLQAR